MSLHDDIQNTYMVTEGTTTQTINELFRSHSIDGVCWIADQVLEKDLSKVIVTDNYMLQSHIALWPEYFGTYLYNPQYIDRLPTALYNCFINRPDGFRQSWIYKFVEHNLLDDGIVSYRCVYNARDLPPEVEGNAQKVFEYYFQKDNTNFAKEHELVKHRMPMRIEGTLDQAIIDSKISLILETYFEKNHSVALSEKIFRTLQLPRPFLLFSSLGAVEFLRVCGFDVYDDIVDHSYDQLDVESHIKQSILLDQIKSWQSINYSANLVARLQKGCKHNIDRLVDLKNKWPEKIKQVITQLETNELR